MTKDIANKCLYNIKLDYKNGNCVLKKKKNSKSYPIYRMKKSTSFFFN